MAAPYFNSDKTFHDQLEKYAWDQLNWILGLNPFDCCMLHGSGHNNLYLSRRQFVCVHARPWWNLQRNNRRI